MPRLPASVDWPWLRLGLTGEDGAEFFHYLWLALGEILGLRRIGFVVVEFEIGFVGWRARFLPLDQAVAFGADRAANATFSTREGMAGMIADPNGRVLQDGYQAQSIDRLGNRRLRQAGELRQRGVDVHGFGELARCAGFHAGSDDEEGNV